jgi:hypothetical protein
MISSGMLLLLHYLLRIINEKEEEEEEENYFILYLKKRALALHDGITEKIDSLPRNACGVIIVSSSGRSGL